MFEFKANNMTMYDAKLMKIGESNLNNTIITAELDTSSLSKEKLSFTYEATFEVSDVDCSQFLGCTNSINNKPFNLEYNIPIMVQARWHKKKRINKKWLKRYGMKKDSVLAKCDVESISPNTGYDLYPTEHVEFDMTFNNMRYSLRPDQLRRDLKIEMYCE